tara:strand:+ start:732 stop:1685 length:954 start_codon:yes stop_codon:yes gene_type:complete
MDPSSLTKTSFSGKTVDNVTNNELKKFILDDMKLKCGGILYNSRYAKVYNEQYSRNLNNPHIICLKSSGTPYLLYCTQINGVNYTFLIDKKIKVGYDFPKIFVTPYQFDSSLFSGTLFEAELVRSKTNKWFLLIADIYYHKSSSCKNIVIMDRMNLIQNLFETEYNSDSFCDVCPIQVKRYFDYSEKEYIMNKFIPKLDYGSRGFYFVPLKCSYSKILYLFKEGDLKKPEKVKKNTLNFMIQKTLKSDVYELYLQGPNNIVKHGIACVPNLKCSLILRDLFSDDTETVCVECKYNEKFKKWEPLQKTTEPMSKVDEV